MIEFQNATIYQEQNKVLENFSLNIKSDENIAIIGPNGSGKSTFLKCITKELHPLHKEPPAIKVNGKNRWSIEELRKILGMVSSDLIKKFPQNFTVKEVVLSGFLGSLGVYSHQNPTKKQKQCVEKIAEKMQFTDLIEKPIKALSSGQTQKIFLARAYVHSPQCYILDEPTNALDIKEKQNFLAQLRQVINQEKSQVLLVTHDISEIIPEITRIIFIKNGEIIQDLPKEKALNKEHIESLFETRITKVQKNTQNFYQVIY